MIKFLDPFFFKNTLIRLFAQKVEQTLNTGKVLHKEYVIGLKVDTKETKPANQATSQSLQRKGNIIEEGYGNINKYRDRHLSST